MLDAYPRKRRPVRVRLRMSRVQRVLGVAPPPATARRILTGLQLPVRARGRDLEVDVPSFRRDLAIEDDLVEEVIRVWGYDRIPTTFGRGDVALARDSETGRQERARARDPRRRRPRGVRHLRLQRSRPVGGARASRALKLLNRSARTPRPLREASPGGPARRGSRPTSAASSLRARLRALRTYEAAPGGDTDTAEPRWAVVALAARAPRPAGTRPRRRSTCSTPRAWPSWSSRASA